MEAACKRSREIKYTHLERRSFTRVIRGLYGDPMTSVLGTGGPRGGHDIIDSSPRWDASMTRGNGDHGLATPTPYSWHRAFFDRSRHRTSDWAGGHPKLEAFG